MPATPNSEMDALRDAIRQGERLRERLNTPGSAPVTAQSGAPQSGYVVPTPKQLSGAVMSWHAGVFLLCYMLLPGFMGFFGLGVGVSFLPSLVAVGGVSLLLVGALRLFGAEVRLPRDLANAPRDPVIAAAAGSFVTWLLLHNSLPWLEHFSAMNGLTAVAFAATNVMESALFGAMLASFTRRTSVAALLGVAHQMALMALFSAMFLLFWFPAMLI